MLKKLCLEAFPSGSENKLDIIKRLEEFCDEVYKDRFENIIGIKKGTSGKKILIDAHADEIALVVSEILDNGLIKFQTAGGIDARILPCTEVIVHGDEELFGVIGAKPPHLLSKEDREHSIEIENLTIDVGLKNTKDVVSVGDFVTFRQNFTELSGGFVSSKSLDNRSGLAAVIDAVSKADSPHDLVILASSGEEVGCVGASGAVCDLDFDMAVVVDVTFGKSHKLESDHCFDLGSGAMLCTGPNICKKLFDNVKSIAEGLNIPYDVEVEGGDTGTNAGVIQLSNSGVATCLISIPLRYMHSPTEVVKLSDVENVSKLLTAVLERGGGILA